jgi:hypothetical protein
MNTHHHLGYFLLSPHFSLLHAPVLVTLSQILSHSTCQASVAGCLQVCTLQRLHADLGNLIHHSELPWLCVFCWHFLIAELLAHRLPGCLRQGRHRLLISGFGQGCVTRARLETMITAQDHAEGTTAVCWTWHASSAPLCCV